MVVFIIYMFSSWARLVVGRYLDSPAVVFENPAMHLSLRAQNDEATIMHLLGIDHEKLSVRQNGIDRRLTDVHGHVVEEVLAGQCDFNSKLR